MPYFPIQLPPGLYRNGTEYQSMGRWYDGDLVRFHEGAIRPIGGWTKISTTAMTGMARSIITWADNTSPVPNTWAAVGTHAKLYAMTRSGALSNITPYRASGTLGTDPLTTTNTSAVVSVAHTSHGLTTGDTAVIAGATAVGGITPNGTFTVTVDDANTYHYTFTSAATSSATGGGASVTYGYEISPGASDSTTGAGYGSGDYGSGTYGTPRPDTTVVTPVSVWALDTWGEDLVAIRDDQGKIYQWSLDVNTRAAVVSNAPTSCSGLVVTQERILMALGASGNPRRVAWSDQEDNTTWTAAATNQAGGFNLQTAGELRCGRRVKAGTLLLTTIDAWLAQYTGDSSVYSFDKVGSNCGICSKGGIATLSNGKAAWMGRSAFWLFDGYVSEVPCDVYDYVFGNINTLQFSKVTAETNAAFNEVSWHYCSADASEIDSYVTWNYKDNTWTFGTLARLAGTDQGAFNYPLRTADDGYVYEHENGLSYDGASPYLEGGPMQLGTGETLMNVTSFVPDENTAGDVTVTFKAKTFPNGTETSHGPYSAANPIDLRFIGRQVKVRFTGNTASVLADWRVGTPRVEASAGSRR